MPNCYVALNFLSFENEKFAVFQYNVASNLMFYKTNGLLFKKNALCRNYMYLSKTCSVRRIF